MGIILFKLVHVEYLLYVGTWDYYCNLIFLLQTMLSLSLKVFACFVQEWITECYKERKLVEIETYLMHAGKPWRCQSVSHESSQGYLSPSLSIPLSPIPPQTCQIICVLNKDGLIELNIVNDTSS